MIRALILVLNQIYIIEIGDSKYKKTGKHNLLTTMELMSLRYYSIYYPECKR